MRNLHPADNKNRQTLSYLWGGCLLLFVSSASLLGNGVFTPSTESSATPSSTLTQTSTITPTPTSTTGSEQTNFPTATFTFQPSETPSPTPTLTATQTSTTTPLSVTPVTIKGDYVPGQVLVKIKSNSNQQAIQDLQTIGFTVHENTTNDALAKLNYVLITVPEGKVAESISQINLLSNVIRAEPNYLVSIQDTIPSDPMFGSQWALTNIRAPQGWDLETGSSSIVIAILDTGIDYGNPDFTGKALAGYDFYYNDGDPSDDHGHGTNVAGIAAAWGNNGYGISGVSWGAKILPVKVLSSFGGGSYAGVAAGIVWAANNNAHVINLSLGGTSPPSDTVLLDAVNYAYNRGVVIVASSGNSGGSVMYPARYANVIAVGATDSTNTWASFSNSGPEMDLCAPGVSILTTGLSNTFLNKTGTSYSTPHVSGLAAVLMSIPGNASPSLVKFIMESTALDVGFPGPDINCGAGLIQMDAAILAALPPTPTPTFTFTPVPTNVPSNSSGQGPGGFIITSTATVTIWIDTMTPQAATSTLIFGTKVPLETPNPESLREEVQIAGDIGSGENDGAFVEKNKGLMIFTVCLWGILLLLVVVAVRRDREKEQKG